MSSVGFSTGALALGNVMHALEVLRSKHTDVVELSALRWSELPALQRALSSLDLSHFRYKAVHAPTDAPDECELVARLKEIADHGLNIVVHPDTIHTFSLWERLDARLCIENMDSRKSTGRTAEELRPIFEKLPKAKLCFDVAHARQVDPTMTETTRILLTFSDRMVQVHLSEVNSKGRHFSISFTAKLAYRPFAAFLSRVPVILESPVDEEGIDSEIREAREVLGDFGE